MVIQTQSTEILGVARLDEKQWEVWCHIDTGQPYRAGALKAHFPGGVTLSISTCGLALINTLRIEMHGLLYPESYDLRSYFQAFAIPCFESEAERSFPESFLSILLDLQRVMGLVTLWESTKLEPSLPPGMTRSWKKCCQPVFLLWKVMGRGCATRQLQVLRIQKTNKIG